MIEELPESIAPTAYPGLETINEDFSGKRWNEFSLRTVALNVDDIVLLTGPALQYYFPAFLFCAIEDSAVSLDHLITSLSNGGPTTSDRSAFTDDQKTLICDFIQWVKEEGEWTDREELVVIQMKWKPTSRKSH